MLVILVAVLVNVTTCSYISPISKIVFKSNTTVHGTPNYLVDHTNKMFNLIKCIY